MAEYINREELFRQGEWMYDPKAECDADALRYVVKMNTINLMPTVNAISLDRIKELREEIENEVKFWSEPSKYNVKPLIAIKNAKAQSYKHCLEILDKIIKSEE